jgi:6,7-dimethyl-8-ribityllumazine synthase
MADLNFGGGAGNVLEFAILASEFNRTVSEKLVAGAEERFQKEGYQNVNVEWVAGAFELPLAAKRLALSGNYDAIVCLGAVIRGETGHYDIVAGEAARGLMEVGLDTGVPVVFGVLTTENLEQAMDRAGGAHGNKGWDCAQTAMEMAAFVRNHPARGSR